MTYEDEVQKVMKWYYGESDKIYEKDYPKYSGLDGPRTMDLNALKTEYRKKLKELKKKYNIE